ncbi:MAG: hypothetical protein PHC70_00545 [Patescibacteria group bacterium]|nr:hypothetical protein [Patescibacteria group bacterium]
MSFIKMMTSFALVTLGMACGGKVENNYYQTFVTPSSSSPATDAAPPVQPDGGKAEASCEPTLTITEKEEGNQPDFLSTYPAGFEDAVFLGMNYCANSCRDIVAKDIRVQLKNLQDGQPLHIEDKWNFSGARLRGNWWADTVSGPVNLVSGPGTQIAYADFHNPFTVKADGCVHLRFTINIALDEAYPGTLYNNQFQASVALASADNGDTEIVINHKDVIKTVTPPEGYDAGSDAGSDGASSEAVYCDPYDPDPQKAYLGCCGTFKKVSLGNLKPGDLIKASGIHSVYYFGSNGKRYVFPTSIELDSWYAPLDINSIPIHDYDAVCQNVLEITEAELAAIPLGGGNVTRRPGAYIMGIATDPKRYVVDYHHVLRMASPQILEGIYPYPGEVQARTYLIADNFFVDYTMGSSLASADDYIWLLKYPQADIEVELGIKP